MKNVAFGIASAALLLMTGSVAAADLTGVVIAKDEVVTGDWTGVYVGGHVGYGFGQTVDSLDCGDDAPLGSVSWIAGQGVGCDGNGLPVAITALANPDGGAPWFTSDDLSDLAGWLAGAQIGYNHQFGSIVVGAEVSGSLAAISDTGVTEITFLNGPLEPGIYEGTMDINWLATATGKVGFALGDNMLISAVGGLAWAGTEFQSSAGYSDQKVAQGFTVGSQVDVKLSENVSVFGAYNYLWFDDVSYEGSSAGGFIANFHEYDTQLHVLKAGINYQFD
ncbi:MAG: OmpA-like transrane domain protein [Devosia sp.]|uniref:outer membrane protein n=1 Tax=Devosia sp. TaxID=1871048 RepID=UPI0026338A59|nr:outer membrane beta-barrel protein [Devosia sp.]MDB5540542.1 OmpA-like transrane domain protein [Devosia sp.]